MGISMSQIRQIKCDGEGCTRDVIYDAKDHQAVLNNPDNSWLMSGRNLKTADNREFFYCSDACELAALKAGKHNQPVVQPATTQADVNAAVEMAKKRADAEAQLRKGPAVTLD